MHDGPGEIAPKATEDFLFHLYRGSELLLDNRVTEARDELEQALEHHPRDAKGQDLLGVVCFRLGLYPRATAIYEGLLAEYPNDAALSQNLSLCYLKTGQAEKARALLEDLVIELPGQRRAWSYLGLAHEQLGHYEKARAAFELGKRHAMARRMDERLASSVPPAPASSKSKLVAAPAPVADKLPAPTTRVSRGEVPSLAELARSGVLQFGDAAAVMHPSGLVLVRIAAGFAARRSAVHLLASDAPEISLSPLVRRVRSRSTNEPLGGLEDPLVLLGGPGRVTLAPRRGGRLLAFFMESDLVFLREAVLVGFDASLAYENGRLAEFEGEGAALVQLRGSGNVVLMTGGTVVAAVVKNDSAAVFARDAVLGWAGRLLPRRAMPAEAPPLGPDFVSLSGEGTIFLSAGDGAAER
jgi:hypothetical protein